MKRALLYDIVVGLILALLWVIIGPIAGYHHVVGVALVYIFFPWLLVTVPLIIIGLVLARLMQWLSRR